MKILFYNQKNSLQFLKRPQIPNYLVTWIAHFSFPFSILPFYIFNCTFPIIHLFHSKIDDCCNGPPFPQFPFSAPQNRPIILNRFIPPWRGTSSSFLPPPTSSTKSPSPRFADRLGLNRSSSHILPIRPQNHSFSLNIHLISMPPHHLAIAASSICPPTFPSILPFKLAPPVCSSRRRHLAAWPNSPISPFASILPLSSIHF